MTLPFVENGLAIEKSHPRFIACLLRIGDLLDIDNNRFSETALRSIGSIPYDSYLHWQKHCSITHIRIDNKHIEATAKCPSPQVAKVTNDWFDLIIQEFNNQTIRWNNIVPEEYLCYLPTLGNLKVDIEGYEDVNISEMPKFSINTDKALELLQGNNLYQSPFDSIRELLQNAVDSSLIRYFLDVESNHTIPNGITKEFLQQLEQYSIKVTSEITDKKEAIITIQDNGIGLKRTHLRFLSNTGSSPENKEKRAIIERMPDWLRPSGIFGIGFQSIFLLTDKVEIVTKDYFTDDCYALEMYKPASHMHGDIYIRKCEDLPSAGMRITIKIYPEIIEQSMYSDPFNSTGFTDFFFTINKEIKSYASMSMIPIYLNGVKIEREKFNFYDTQTGIELILNNENKTRGVYYKNAKVENSAISTKFLHPTINIHKQPANEVLTIDRHRIKSASEDELNKNIIMTLIHYISSKSFVEPSENMKFSYMAFIKYYDKNRQIENRDFIPDIEKQNLNILNKYDKITLEMLLSAKSVTFRTLTPECPIIQYKNKEDGNYLIHGNTIGIYTSVFWSEFSNMLFALLTETYSNCFLKNQYTEQLFQGGEFVFTNDSSTDTNFTETEFKKLDIHISSERRFLFYISGYDDLFIPSNSTNEYNIKLETEGISIPSSNVNKILSPFLAINGTVKDARNTEFYEYVHKLNGKPLKSIKESYDRFVKFCKDNGLVPANI